MTSLETLAVRSRAFLDQGSSVSGVYVGCNKRKGPEVGKTLECWQKNMQGPTVRSFIFILNRMGCDMT
jgi:hypothetical protein